MILKTSLGVAAIALGLAWQAPERPAMAPRVHIAASTTFKACKTKCVKKYNCKMETAGPNKLKCRVGQNACIKACPK